MRKTQKNITAKAISIMLAVIFLSCDACVTCKECIMSTISLSVKLQFIKTENGEMVNIYDSSAIFYYQDFIMYRATIPFTQAIPTMNKKDSVISEEVKEGVEYKFFIYTRNDSSGLVY